MKKSVWLWLLPGLLSACGTDLGECEQPADGVYLGRDKLRSNCASCHSYAAEGVARAGAPAGLNFDVPTVANSEEDVAIFMAGIANVRKYAEEIWAVVDSGTMPPSGELQEEDKQDIRNWLACGAPGEPPALSTGGGAQGFDLVFSQLDACTTCHSTAVAATAGGGFLFGDSGDACGAYTNVVSVASATDTCGGTSYVVPNDPDASLLLQKMEAPLCGGLMPLGAQEPWAESGNATQVAAVQGLRDWIAQGAPPPEGCP